MPAPARPARPRASAPDPRKLREEDQRKKARAKAEAFNDYQLKIHVGDDVFSFRGGAVTFRHVAEFRRATGAVEIDPVMGLLLGVTDSAMPPPDYVGQLIWLARLQAGERVELDDVLDGFTLDNEVWLEFPEQSPDPGEAGVVFPDPPSRGDGSPT